MLIPPEAVGEGVVCGLPGQLTNSEGKVPTVQPLVPVGAGAAVPVPPFAIESGKLGPAEAVGHTGTFTVRPTAFTAAPQAVAVAFALGVGYGDGHTGTWMTTAPPAGPGVTAAPQAVAVAPTVVTSPVPEGTGLTHTMVVLTSEPYWSYPANWQEGTGVGVAARAERSQWKSVRPLSTTNAHTSAKTPANTFFT